MPRWCSLRFDFVAMASPCTLLIDAQDEGQMRQAADAAMAEVRRIEAKFSRYRADSVLARIHNQAGLAPVPIDPETASLLAFADQLWRQSDGLFDITSGVLRRAWDFGRAALPQPEALQRCLELVGWSRVERGDAGVRLPVAGMELDFGGFGKEYAADRAAMVLHQHGIQHALVNLGGDLHALGPRGLPECAGQAWTIDIQHPRPTSADDDTPLAQLELARGGLATSGDYERFFELDGRRYSHILDPRTGWPVQGLQSVSVLDATTTSAGALATLAMLKGATASRWLEDQQVRYLLVHEDGLLQHSTAPRPAAPHSIPATQCP